MNNITCPLRTTNVECKNTTIVNLDLVVEIQQRNYREPLNPNRYVIYFNTTKSIVEWYYDTEAQRDEVYELLLTHYSSPVAKPVYHCSYDLPK